MVAQQLALAHYLDAIVARGEVAHRAALARRLGPTRAQITQLFAFVMLASDLQEAVLCHEAIDGRERMSEKMLSTQDEYLARLTGAGVMLLADSDSAQRFAFAAITLPRLRRESPALHLRTSPLGAR